MLILSIICAIFANGIAESAVDYGTSRIIGGEKAEIGNFKWQAALLKNSAFFCGGTIISPTKILTAAHCNERIDVNKVQARVGSSNPKEEGVLRSIVKIRSHPEYNRPSSMNNDVAVVFLSESVFFGTTIGAILMAGKSITLPSDTNVVVSGFGVTTPDGNQADVLHSVSVPIVDYDVCSKAYKSYQGPAKLTKNMICAGLYGIGGKDVCKGDSGGPMVYKSGNSDPILYGIVSWGAKCADPNYPGVYAKLSVYREFH